MGTRKKDGEDIITHSEDAPAFISDDTLEDVNGGYELRNVFVTSYSTHGEVDTTVTGSLSFDTTVTARNSPDIINPDSMRTFRKR